MRDAQISQEICSRYQNVVPLGECVFQMLKTKDKPEAGSQERQNAA